VAEPGQEKDQKTEDATPRRREEARENGQVALSNELVAAAMLGAGLGALLLGGAYLVQSASQLIAGTLVLMRSAGRSALSAGDSAELVRESFRSVLPALLAVLVPVVVVGLVAGYGQAAFRVTPKAVALDPSKVDPIKGLGRIFSLKAVVRTGLAAAKVAVIAITMALIAWSQLDELIRMGPAELGPLLVGLGSIALRCTAGALVAIAALSLIDFAFQRWQHDRDLRMTKQEIKEERRITEGDPHLKAHVRQVQREMATRRMMADVPKATVVVTNPTHYAVALSYERDEDDVPVVHAPRCVAKGADHLAQRIKDVARDAGILCYEDVPLARSLYAQVEIGAEIPAELYTAVAEVLSYVYRVQGVKLAAVS